jgi:serine/threonine protein kinase
LPSDLLHRDDSPIPSAETRNRIAELVMGAEIAGQYRLDTYINSGTFGHGWAATDMQNGNEVFVKTFKTDQEFDPGQDMVVPKMVYELEVAERISQVKRLMDHPNVVAVLKVPRNAMIKIPATGKSGPHFHGIVTEYCDGGELFNYLVVPRGAGGLEGCSFTETQARFLFKQIIALMLCLHHPEPSEGEAYFHGDIKDQNFVLAGTTLKLIDYGTLSKVEDNVGEVRHMTPTHQQPFHNNCESVDLWAAGIILLDMLLIGSIGQVFSMSNGINRGVLHLKAGQLWDQLRLALRRGDPNHCLLKTGPDSALDLLQKIFVMQPMNSLSVKEIAEHPWLKGEMATDEEMATELKSRFAGIMQGAPRGTAFFDLGDTTVEKGTDIMNNVVDVACKNSNGEFVLGGPARKPHAIYIHRWDRPHDTDTGIDRMDASEAQWVVGKYVCNVEKSDFNLDKGRPCIRIRLFWESGSQHEDFYRLSSAILAQVMALHLV